MTDTLTIELTREQAESIMNADSVAQGETTTAAVDAELRKKITAKWPELRAEYGAPGDPRGEYYVRTEHMGNMATHDWVLRVETWDGEPSAQNPHPKRETYAAPEIAGVEPGTPFVTAIAQQSRLTVLFPRNVPVGLRMGCMAALEASGIMNQPLDERGQTLGRACSSALDTWWKLINSGHIWWDAPACTWRGIADVGYPRFGKGRA